LLQPSRDRAAFDPARSFKHGSQTSSVLWSNDVAGITSVGLSRKPEAHFIARVIGNDPLRQFLVPFPGGRFQTLEASYDPHANEWFDVYGNEDRQPGEWGHWTGRGMNWNFMCAGCHNTRLRRNYDEPTDSYHTTMAEMSVGCEACHGPMKAHNEWQKQFGKSGKKDPTLTKLTREQVLDTCGSCHARRTELTGDFKPGDHFADHFDLEVVDRNDHYYADGQVREEDYEYGSFLGSRMHLRGVVCLDCHNAHSYKTTLPGNWLCLRCHDGSNLNAPKIDPVAHSHHQVYGFDTNGHPVKVDLAAYDPKSVTQTGGQCVNCHMPQTVYMQRHWRHDHGFTSPDPLLTKESGIPNACNRCHQDKDADWALNHCEQWYGQKMDRPARRRAQLIAQVRRDDPKSFDGLLASLKTEESPYWRAALLGLLMPWATQPDVAAVLVRNLDDTNAQVRAAAARALEPAVATAQTNAIQALQSHLEDPVRSARIAAAWSLRFGLDPKSSAGEELQRYLQNIADEPVGQMQAGVYYFSRNEPAAALPHFQKAVAWDPYSAVIHQELAVVLSALNRPQEAVRTLEEACRLVPQDAELHYQLGLAYNEAGDLKSAAEQLARATQLDPRRALAWYNLGLAQNSLGQPDAAIESLLRAETVAPDDARIPYARATILANLGRTREANRAVKRALEINPAFPEARRLLLLLPD
jgi:tetratricopeptide (TPR) repeat protein